MKKLIKAKETITIITANMIMITDIMVIPKEIIMMIIAIIMKKMTKIIIIVSPITKNETIIDTEKKMIKSKQYKLILLILYENINYLFILDVCC